MKRVLFSDAAAFRNLIFVVASILFLPTAEAATVGLYAANFDPPTFESIAVVRCALGEASVNKECPEIGKPIGRVMVLVSQAGADDPLASLRERVLMVKKALQKYGNRVEVITGPNDTQEQARSLLADRSVERLIWFMDEGAYKGAGLSSVEQDRRLLRIVISANKPDDSAAAADSSSVKILSGIEPAKGELLDSAVKQVIERLGLYQPVSKDLAPLQRSLFEESWKGFLKDFKAACPTLSDQKQCAELATNWDSVAIVTDEQRNRAARDDASANLLVYKAAQSADRWAEKFTDTAVKFLQGSSNYSTFKAAADDMTSKVYEGYPDDKLFYLRKMTAPKRPASVEVLDVSQKSVACSPPRGPYHMNIAEYTADRFPLAFSAFLQQQFRQRSIASTELYVHNQTFEAAYEFHRSAGFSTFYFLQTRRGQLHRNIYLAERSTPHAYRVVFSDVRGRDQEADVFCQVYHSGTFSRFHRVQAKLGLSLFVLNPSGNSLKLNHNDWLLFGFKGKWAKILKEQGWQDHPLVKEGLDIDLFTHPTIKQRLVIARNVYGDDANIVLDTFYKKGVRQVVYLGTSGAIANYQVGDVTIPNHAIDNNQNAVPFERNLAHAYSAELADRVRLHTQTKHGSVQTIYQETEALLLDWKAKSVAAMDVEGIYLARFAERHKDLKMSAFFVISDQTLGDSTIEESESRLDVIDESVYKLVSFLLPRILAAN